MEGKHNEIIEKTVYRGFTRTLLKSMEFKVLDPVCPSYYTNLCGKKIRLEEMSQHLVSCEHLHYLESNMILNTEYEDSWYTPNFKISHEPVVFKLKESQQFFILQGRSTGTSFSFYIIQHNEENISEHQYIAHLEVYGSETKNIIRTQTVRVCPSGIHHENARNQFYTLDISHQELENMCVTKIPTDDVSKKYNVYVKFKVMII